MSSDSSPILPPPDAGRDEQVPAMACAGRSVLPKRFYERAHTELQGNVYPLLLDGRAAKTPNRAPLAVPYSEIADILVQEWQLQADVINPSTMPMTRLINSIIDGVSQVQADVTAEIVRYSASDLLCYRASSPERLVKRQEQLWNPLLDWAREQLDARFILSEGVMFVEQPANSIATIFQIISGQPSPYAIGAFHVITTLTGSALIALAVAYQRLTPEEAWIIAHVDEDVQAEIWGVDEEAMIRRDARLAEFNAAASLLRNAWCL